MPTPRYRAWQFVHPDIPEGGLASGLQVSPRGKIAMVDGNDSVRQAIFMLISTVPGERVMRPNYGCLVHRLIFSPNDDTTAGLAIYYVRRALDQWEPRAEIIDLNAGRDPDRSEIMEITLTYRVRATLQTDTLTFRLNLAGESP
jgi:phage baseplate assembly protein W